MRPRKVDLCLVVISTAVLALLSKYFVHFSRSLSGAPLMNWTFLDPSFTTVDMHFLLLSKSSCTMVLYFLWQTVSLSLIILEARTRRAASVGSPNLWYSPSSCFTTLELLLTAQPWANRVNNSYVFLNSPSKLLPILQFSGE